MPKIGCFDKIGSIVLRRLMSANKTQLCHPKRSEEFLAVKGKGPWCC